MRSGKGELSYAPHDDSPKDLERNNSLRESDAVNIESDDSKLHQKFQRRYCGYMIADHIAPGGLQVVSNGGFPMSINTRVEASSRPLKMINKNMHRRMLRLRRDKEKLSFMETQVRVDICKVQYF